MLDNTKKGFVEEIVIVATLDILTGLALLLTHKSSSEGISAGDYFMAFIVPLFIYFPFMRLMRYAFVFRAYVVLYFMYSFFFIVLLFIGIDVFKDLTQGLKFGGSEIFFIIILVGAILYTLWIYSLRVKGLFKKTVPPERIQMLCSILTRKQKFTMILPERYMKFLDTGDVKYIRGEE